MRRDLRLTFLKQSDTLIDNLELTLTSTEHLPNEEGLDGSVEDEDGYSDEGRPSHVDDEKSDSDEDLYRLDPDDVNQEGSPVEEGCIAEMMKIKGEEISVGRGKDASNSDTNLETRVTS